MKARRGKKGNEDQGRGGRKLKKQMKAKRKKKSEGKEMEKGQNHTVTVINDRVDRRTTDDVKVGLKVGMGALRKKKKIRKKGTNEGMTNGQEGEGER